MGPEHLLDQLLDLARAAGVEVREIKAADDSESGLRSASCRLRGRLLVMLVATDPLEERIFAVADALDEADPGWLETHYVPPALRSRLEGRSGGSRGEGGGRP